MTRCPPPEIQRLLERRALFTGLTWALCLSSALFFVLTAQASLITSKGPVVHPAVPIALYLASGILFILGVGSYARGKGRSLLWGFLGFGLLLGWIVLWCLPSRCLYCDRLARRRDCPDCGAPI